MKRKRLKYTKKLTMTTEHDYNFKGRIIVQENWGKPSLTKLPENKVIKNITKSGDLLPSTLVISVSYEVIELVSKGILDVLVIQKCPYYTSRLYDKYGRLKNYSTIKLFASNQLINKKKVKASLVCPYHGFFIAQSNHELKVDKYQKFVRAGSYILKIGEVL